MRMPRVLVALYDGKTQSSPRNTPIHRFLEMPANHLGYDIQYYDVNSTLPVLGAQVAGVVLWFEAGFEATDPLALVEWLEKAFKSGKKALLIENPGFGSAMYDNTSGVEILNQALAPLGVHSNNNWRDITYPAQVSYTDPEMIGFERDVPIPIPAFMDTVALGKDVVSHLKLAIADSPDHPRDLVITSPAGGYIAQGFALQHTKNTKTGKMVSQWIVDPFAFLEASLGHSVFPKPDTTTLLGRRVFFGLIDGDGWNQPTELPRYAESSDVAAEVIRGEILSQFTDFPFNVGVIAGDVDVNCYGTLAGVKALRNIAKLKNVELAAHSYTHPLYWKFFENYTPAKEIEFLNGYPEKPKDRKLIPDSMLSGNQANPWEAYQQNDSLPQTNEMRTESALVKKLFGTPRSYGCMPFNLDTELKGAADYIQKMAGTPYQVRLIQWSGDTRPFERALIKTRLSKMYNIGGSSGSFGGDEPTLSNIGPIGLQLGSEHQIYSGYANEVTYTNYWSNNFYGLRQYSSFMQATDLPRRLTPASYYFHMAAGQKQSMVNAIADTLRKVRKLDVLPITASQYAAIAEGFYSSTISQLSPDLWMVRNRGGLQTIRFDHASRKSVDLTASKGILGQRYLHGSLYVFLDPQVAYPVIKLINNDFIAPHPPSQVPYILESSWQIRNLIQSKNLLMFAVYGFGPGKLQWKLPEAGRFTVTAYKKGTLVFTDEVKSDADNILTVLFPPTLHAITPLDVTFRSLN